MKTKSTRILLIVLLAISCVKNESPKTIDVSKNWRFSADEKNIDISENWEAVDFDDSQWKTIDTGIKWEE